MGLVVTRKVSEKIRLSIDGETVCEFQLVEIRNKNQVRIKIDTAPEVRIERISPEGLSEHKPRAKK